MSKKKKRPRSTRPLRQIINDAAANVGRAAKVAGDEFLYGGGALGLAGLRTARRLAADGFVKGRDASEDEKKKRKKLLKKKKQRGPKL